MTKCVPLRPAEPDDQCPGQPETINRYQDADGCPDTLPSDLERLDTLGSSLRFPAAAPGAVKRAAQLDARARAAVRRAAAILTAHPKMHVALIGHNDNREATRDHDIPSLSDARVKAVRDALIAAGITSERLHLRTAGSHEPHDRRDSEAARAKNRRVDVELLGELPAGP